MQLGFSPVLYSVNICSQQRRSSANGSALTTTMSALCNKHFQSLTQMSALV